MCLLSKLLESQRDILISASDPLKNRKIAITLLNEADMEAHLSHQFCSKKSQDTLLTRIPDTDKARQG